MINNLYQQRSGMVFPHTTHTADDLASLIMFNRDENIVVKR